MSDVAEFPNYPREYVEWENGLISPANYDEWVTELTGLRSGQRAEEKFILRYLFNNPPRSKLYGNRKSDWEFKKRREAQELWKDLDLGWDRVPYPQLVHFPEGYALSVQVFPIPFIAALQNMSKSRKRDGSCAICGRPLNAWFDKPWDVRVDPKTGKEKHIFNFGQHRAFNTKVGKAHQGCNTSYAYCMKHGTYTSNLTREVLLRW